MKQIHDFDSKGDVFLLMKGEMKAQVFYKASTMQLETIPIPQIEHNEVLIKVKACGICGSDISYYYGHSPTDVEGGAGPLVLGHEFSGIIVEIGDLAKRKCQFTVGDKVIVNPMMVCNACPECAEARYNLCRNNRSKGVAENGGFAEYCKVPYTNLFELPTNMTFEQGAITEPLVCASYGMKNLGIQIGDFVVIIGPGPIGLMMVQMAKASGAGKIALIGRSDFKLECGRKFGADYLFNIAEKSSPYFCEDVKPRIKDLNKGELARRVIVPTNAISALEQALEVSGNSSTIVFFGLPSENDYIKIPVLQTILMDKTIKFSWLGPLMWPTALKAIETGKVDVLGLITHRFKIDELKTAIEFMANSKENKLKGLLVFD